MNIALYAHHGPQFFRCAGKQFYYFLMKRGKKMKKLSKTLLSVAAVTAVSAAMAASAMAMTATYDAETGMVTLSDVASTGDSQTLLVVGGDSVGATVATEDIKQIDQDDTGVSFATVPVGQLDDGTYEVRIGGNGEIQRATFNVGGVQPGGETKTIMVGDVNWTEDVDALDALAVARYAAKATTLTEKTGEVYQVAGSEDTYTIGDVNTSGDVDALDALSVARYAAKATTMIDNAGQSVTIVVE